MKLLLLFLLLLYTIQDLEEEFADCLEEGGHSIPECYSRIYGGGSGGFGDDDYIFKAKCPDDKTKTNACFFTNTIISGSSSKTEYLIFKKCGKGEKCDYEGRGICRDDDRKKKKKNGKSCNYDDDCLCRKCVSNKCTVKKEGEICFSSSGRYSCEAGLTCYYSGSGDGKCVKLILTDGTKCENSYCGQGLIFGPEQKCRKYGTIEDGAETTDELLCKSGLSNQKDGKTICDRIETDPICEDGKVKTAGKWAKGGDIPVDTTCSSHEDYNGNDIYYFSKSKLQSKLYEEFLEDYNDLDLEDLNTKDKYFNMDFEDMLKWKTYKKYLLYENAPALQAAKLIDSDGEVVSDKKCEYDFIMKNVLSSSNTKVGLLLLALFALLL